MTVREKASANIEARFQKIMKSSEGIEIQIQTRQERIEALTEKIKTASEYMKSSYSLTINAYKQEIKQLKSQLS
jgi:archaellum component FlaC